MKNILIPTDFSENSHNAINYALRYFAQEPVNFYFLHVSSEAASQDQILDGGHYASGENLPTVQGTAALMKEEIKTCQLLAKNSGHRFFPVHESITLVEAIRKQVVEKEIDYILMGTRGNSRRNGGEMGSNTCDVITKVKCPIIVIPESARFKGIRNIGFVTDYNCIFRNKVISRLSETLEAHGAPLRILHIKSKSLGLTPAQTDNKGFLHYFFKEKKHSFHFVENKDLETGIQDFIDTWDVDMVSIVAKNLNFIQRLLLRPAAEKIVFEAKVPFLVLHE